MNYYISAKNASKLLNVSIYTLRNWGNSGKIDTIRTIGNHRRYDIRKIIKSTNNVDNTLQITNKLNICYVRVSTNNQKDDLLRQIKYMKLLYPSYTIIKDIGSGINFNRKGLRLIIKYAIKGLINNLVLAYKDRLTRFGFELIEDIIKEYSNGKIIIINKKFNKGHTEEIVEDVLQILNVYNAKINGMRKYNKKLISKKN
jgi:predicted site-specific integrase-resolvase